ncbi:cation transporter [Motilibacter sp. K478]|nr:cation transporter [Motilibacter aurantiacus]
MAVERAAGGEARLARLRRRASLLAWATIGYNTVEGLVAVAAGSAAGSVALVSFGLDSAVEVLSAIAVMWQFARGGTLAEQRERRALRVIAVAFFALAAYVGYDSARALTGSADPDASPVGIALAAASLVVMPALTWAKRSTGRALSSRTVLADSTQTMLCTYLSAVLLAGLVLNATVGWGWADPLAGLVIAAVAVKEGVDAWRGDACCAGDPPVAGRGAGPDVACACCHPGVLTRVDRQAAAPAGSTCCSGPTPP